MISSNFPALRTGYAEPKESKPLVALVDSFAESLGPCSHGQITESVLMLHGRLQGDEIQNLHGDSGVPFAPEDVFQSPSQSIVERYDDFSSGAMISFYNMASDNLELVVRDLPSVRVVNQSQSQTPARLVEPFLGPIFEDGDFRQRLAAGLALDPQSPPPEVASALLRHTDDLFQRPPELLIARERYLQSSKTAHERGLVQVVAAGNQGELARQMDAAGVVANPTSFRSALVNEWVTVVGAATADGQISSLNSPNSGAELYALGENVPFQIQGRVGRTSGTSVAAPLITSQAADTLKRHPDWTAAQVERDMGCAGDSAESSSKAQS